MFTRAGRCLQLALVALLAACGGGGGGGGGGGFGGASLAAVSAGDASSAAGTSSPGAAGATSSAAGASTTQVAALGPVAGDAVVDSSGKFSADAYRAQAAQMSKAAGIEYRYGPSPTGYGTTGNSGRSNLQAPGDQSYNPIAKDYSGGIGGDRNCLPVGGFCGTWQVGGPLTAGSGDYSASIIQVGYVADNTSQNTGVANLQQIGMAHNAFAQKPQINWATYDGPDTGKNDQNLLDYRRNGKSVSDSVAVARCYGRGGWCVTSLAAFQNGLIAVVGSNTAHNKATVQLAAGKVPTAMAITNSGEFALVTVWDTANLKGQVAVVALAGLCDNCTADNPGGWYDYWGEWRGVYPGLPNLGNVAYMKVLGYVDLPDTMRAPTEISTSTGVSVEDYERVTRLWDHPLSDANNRASFYSGSNSAAIARAGMAVVVSKSEQQAAFIDLRPLFNYYRERYFGGSQGDFNNRMASRGPNDDQWPYTFANDGSQKPTIVKTVALGARPTAVRLGLSGTAGRRAWVATQDGQLHIYNLGNYMNPGSGGAAGEITEVGKVAVGRNPTSIAYAKHGAGTIYSQGGDREVIVTSRGDRRIDWVRFAADFNSGVTRSPALSLNDANLIDPIAAEDADNHGTESYVISVADYGGKRVSNYRYGPVVYWTNSGACQPPGGCGVSGGSFQYGGSFDLPGGAYSVVGANIP